MKGKFIFLLVLLSVFLASCGPLEDILGKLTNKETETTNEQTGDEETTGSEPSEDEERSELDNANEPDEQEDVVNHTENNAISQSVRPIDQRLLDEGHVFLSLPNGFPFQMPYHWILIEDFSNGPNEYSFCYDLPYGVERVAEDIATLIGDEFTIVHEDASGHSLYTTTFTSSYLDGFVEYYLDGNGNTCAKMVFNLDVAEMGDLELTKIQDIIDIDRNQRNRVVPDDYGFQLERIADLAANDVMTFHVDEILSIRESINSGEQSFIHMIKGFPEIFPYEWFLVEENYNYDTGGWTGKMCTDSEMFESIQRHLYMLDQVNADITFYILGGSPQMYSKGEVEFALNDMHGTGSWVGETIFHVDTLEEEIIPFKLDERPTYICSTTTMEFSTDILD